MQYIIFVFALFFGLRLVSLKYSLSNEKRLKRMGAVEYGKRNSLFLALAHISYYFLSLYEACASGTEFNRWSLYGTALMGFAYIMLFYVIFSLRDIWTLKIYIAPDHRIEKSFLFRTVRHPNYFLNIIPELIGVGLLCNSWYTLSIGLPFYSCFLAVRIYQEEKAMRGLWG